MRDSITEKAKQHLKGYIRGYRNEIKSYGDSERLTRKKWLSVRGNWGEIGRLTQKHGQAKVGQWIQQMQMRDQMEGK